MRITSILNYFCKYCTVEKIKSVIVTLFNWTIGFNPSFKYEMKNSRLPFYPVAIVRSICLVGLLIIVSDCLPGTRHTGSDSKPGTLEISELEKVRIGGVDQWLFSQGKSRNNPVLLVLHGGPGAGSIGFARYFYTELEKQFIVVNWDQRGAGKSYSLFMSDVTPETYLSDTHEVILFLKRKFNVPKIYLMGHSWGGYLGAIIANRYPEDLFAYIGIGPVVNGEQSVAISYKFVLENGSKNPEISGKVKDLTQEEYLKNRRFWLNQFGVGLFHDTQRYDEDRFLRGLMEDSPEYSIFDMITYLPGIWRSSSRIRPYFFQMNLFKEAPSIRVPVYFFTGKYDYYNPEEILVKYVNGLEAPKKTFHSFECCAHAPHFEAIADFAEQMKLVKLNTYTK
ncbi:alpha/beta hydrolase family protein [Leptospira fainei serovar Hurstbridge str. BUT 6]|uniref:Proline iminopeptidase n=1 Tax=Leptospira fainei serovar Hurstbridge str. BUT 6 TaxID=1193011 RepID=S3VGM1_9LEPT|nr:alpha/beta hydrolase [Leptospira fainei]EPG75600.1 alpha/beta hydrolase family protein [Leptospira fainei serovar Hurstbridge str. BUT 6]